jgi:hypothetical protein
MEENKIIIGEVHTFFHGSALSVPLIGPVHDYHIINHTHIFGIENPYGH